MNLLKLKVKDLSSGEIYEFNRSGNGNCILEIHYCTSYFQFVVQKEIEKDGIKKYSQKDLCYIFKNVNLIDLIAVNDDELCEIYF